MGLPEQNVPSKNRKENQSQRRSVNRQSSTRKHSSGVSNGFNPHTRRSRRNAQGRAASGSHLSRPRGQGGVQEVEGEGQPDGLGPVHGLRAGRSRGVPRSEALREPHAQR